VLHALALGAAAIRFGWFAPLDGLAGGWAAARPARAGHPFRLLDELLVSAAPDEIARVHVLAFLLGTALGGGLTLLAAIRLARRPVEGTVLSLPALFRARPGRTEQAWDDPVYWREYRSRGARRTLRLGGLLLSGLAVVLFVVRRDPAEGGLWAQFAGLSGAYLNLLTQAGMLMLCLRSSVMIVEERRRGMLAPLALAGISPSRLVGSKLKAAVRPAVPLTALIVIVSVCHITTAISGPIGFTDPRLWLDGVAALAAAGAGYFLAISLGLLASSCAPSLRVALLAGPALLFAWINAPYPVQQVLLLVGPGSPRDMLSWLSLLGSEPGVQVNTLRTKLLLRVGPEDVVSRFVSWVAVATLAGLAACIAAIFRVSREHGRPARRSARIPPGPA
jgi:hypothetical protein